MEHETLKFESRDAVGILTINRPDKLNSLNRTVLGEVERALFELLRDERTRALVVTGAGEKAFCAGADIGEMKGISPMEATAHSTKARHVFALFEQARLPVIAAINGFALGGGLELALACDIRLAAAGAKLGLPEVTLGLIPGFGGTQRLPRIVGKGKALEMILSGEMITADEAHRIGLVDRVVAKESLLDEAVKLGNTIASRGPRAVGLAKQAIHEGLEIDLVSGLKLEANLFGLVFTTKDHREGIDAFMEKRPAKFSGM